jgi:outer membrane immunogenic protein
MKKTIFAVAAIASLAGLSAASAADMAVKARPMPPPVVVYNWTGCYIGGNIGGSWHRVDQSQVGKVDGTVFNPPGNFGSSDGSSFTGGAQIGCDYQFAGNWVVGIQGMFDFLDSNSRHTLPAFPAFYSTTNVKDIFSVTGRLGYLFTPSLLGYVKGGGAWAKADYNIYGFGPPVFLSESANGTTISGWTVGGGVEWMFSPGWSVFGEFNYYDFGHRNISFVQAPNTQGVADIVRTRLQVEQVLVGLNYKFNFGGPVVARY